jgi:hypothetical protein
MEQLMPLIAFCNEQGQWHIESHIEAITQQIKS